MKHTGQSLMPVHNGFPVNAPHHCEPFCPGDQNRRKLEAFDELLETLRATLASASRLADIMVERGGLPYSGFTQDYDAGRAALAHAEEACTKT